MTMVLGEDGLFEQAKKGANAMASVDADTHLIKSSEWGMISYLTHSKYVIKEKEITASTTGNMTGVYYISGGEGEMISSYTTNGNKNLLKYGKSIVYDGDILKTKSTKYTMIYPHDTNLDNANNNYLKNTKIYGDAIRETSTTGTGVTSWNKDYSNFIGENSTFFVRGGDWWVRQNAGNFHFNCSAGDSHFRAGFRPAVVPIY